MTKNLLRLLGLCLIVAAVATCTDQTPTAAPNEDAEALVPTLGDSHACGLVSQMTTDVRNYFQMPERQTASSKMRDLGTACGTASHANMETLAVDLLAMMETAIKQNRAGSVSVGVSLARALLACTTSACSSSVFSTEGFPTEAALTKAIGEPAGMFDVRRGSDATPAVARSWIPFLHQNDDGEEPEANSARYGAQVTGTGGWPAANGTSFVLIYGYRLDNSIVSEQAVGDLRGYSFNRWPEHPSGKFVEDQRVHVGACFDTPIGFTHEVGNQSVEAKGRMQREGTLLAFFASTFDDKCTQPANASILAPVRTFALNLLPRSWSAMFFGDVRTPVIGGSAWDFSNFEPVGASTSGTLTFTTTPVAGATYSRNSNVLDFRVQVRSGGNTPMEVEVELFIGGNQGFPGGAVLEPAPLKRYSDEDHGVAEFLSMKLGKAGGYVVCAKATVPGFTFNQPCTSMFFIN